MTESRHSLKSSRLSSILWAITQHLARCHLVGALAFFVTVQGASGDELIVISGQISEADASLAGLSLGDDPNRVREVLGEPVEIVTNGRFETHRYGDLAVRYRAGIADRLDAISDRAELGNGIHLGMAMAEVSSLFKVNPIQSVLPESDFSSFQLEIVNDSRGFCGVRFEFEGESLTALGLLCWETGELENQ